MDHRGNETEAGYTDFSEIATPSTSPAALNLRVYAKSDGSLYTKNSAGVETQVGSGSSSLGYSALIASMSGLVHRWKFEEASGNFADSVGSLTLTKTGAVTYQQSTAPVSAVGAILFGAAGKGASSTMGSIPVTNAARTIVCVFKPTATGKQTLFSYGTYSSTRQMFTGYINDSSTGVLSTAVWADDALSSCVINDLNLWHISFHASDGATSVYALGDGGAYGVGTARLMGGALNTVDSGNHFLIGQDINAGNQASVYMDDMAVFSRNLDLWEMRKLANALGS